MLLEHRAIPPQRIGERFGPDHLRSQQRRLALARDVQHSALELQESRLLSCAISIESPMNSFSTR